MNCKTLAMKDKVTKREICKADFTASWYPTAMEACPQICDKDCTNQIEE